MLAMYMYMSGVRKSRSFAERCNRAGSRKQLGRDRDSGSEKVSTGACCCCRSSQNNPDKGVREGLERGRLDPAPGLGWAPDMTRVQLMDSRLGPKGGRLLLAPLVVLLPPCSSLGWSAPYWLIYETTLSTFVICCFRHLSSLCVLLAPCLHRP